MQRKSIPIHRRPSRSRAFALAALSACALATGDAIAEGLECVVLPHSVLELSSGVSGRLSTVYVDRADRVEAGQIVAELESDVERANLELAQARASMLSEMRLREASYAFDRRQRARIGDLHERNAVSEQTKDEADRDANLGRWQVSLARERLELAAIELERARAQLALRTVRAPFNGVVLERYKSEGEYVDEDAILQVARLDPLRVEVIAPVELHATFRAGMQANVFTETAPDAPRRALVVAVDAVADPASGTFRARLELPNPDHSLLAGVKCTTELVTAVVDAQPAATQDVSDAAGTVEAVDDVEVAVNAVTADDVDTVDDAAAIADAPAPVVGTSPVTPTETIHLSSDSVDYNGSSDATTRETAEQPTPIAEQPSSMSVADVTSVAPIEPTACQTVGPIDTLQVARGVARQLKNASFDVHRREQAEQKSNGFIVLAMRTNSAESTRDVTKRLRSSGVQDMAPLGRGPFAGRVSLGVYDDIDGANRRVGELSTRSVDAEIRPRHRSAAAWWLDVMVNAGTEQARLRDTVIQHFPSLGIQPTPCPPIQTAQN